MSDDAYVVWRISMMRSVLWLLRSRHIVARIACQLPGDALTASIICTKIASKMASDSVCSGSEIFSSASVTEGYLDREILDSIW